jgi:hypothetical protein
MKRAIDLAGLQQRRSWEQVLRERGKTDLDARGISVLLRGRVWKRRDLADCRLLLSPSPSSYVLAEAAVQGQMLANPGVSACRPPFPSRARDPLCPPRRHCDIMSRHPFIHSVLDRDQRHSLTLLLAVIFPWLKCFLFGPEPILRPLTRTCPSPPLQRRSCSTTSQTTNSPLPPTSSLRRLSSRKQSREFRLPSSTRIICGRNGMKQSSRPTRAHSAKPLPLPPPLPLFPRPRPPNSTPRKRPQDPHHRLPQSRRNPPSALFGSSRNVRLPLTRRLSRPAHQITRPAAPHPPPMRGLLSPGISPSSASVEGLRHPCSKLSVLIIMVQTTMK